MNLRERNVKIDLLREAYQIFKYKQYDNGCKLNLNMYQDNIPVDMSECEAVAVFKRSDGIVYNRNCVTENNTVSLIVDNNITELVGKVLLEVVVLKGEALATSFEILIEVEGSIDRSESIESLPQWEILEELLSFKQDYQLKIDDRLTTNDKTIVGSINLKANSSDVNNSVSRIETSIQDNVDTLNGRIDDTETSIQNNVNTINGRIDGVETSIQNNVNTINGNLDLKANQSYVEEQLALKSNEGHTHDQYLTEHQDLSNYALKSELHEHSNKAVLDGISQENVNNWNGIKTKIMNVASTEWSEVEGKQKVTITHSLGTENVFINIRVTETKESIILNSKIIDGNTIEFTNDTAIGISVILIGVAI